jgi:hypothetical protein
MEGSQEDGLSLSSPVEKIFKNIYRKVLKNILELFLSHFFHKKMFRSIAAL